MPAQDVDSAPARVEDLQEEVLRFVDLANLHPKIDRPADILSLRQPRCNNLASNGYYVIVVGHRNWSMFNARDITNDQCCNSPAPSHVHIEACRQPAVIAHKHRQGITFRIGPRWLNALQCQRSSLP